MTTRKIDYGALRDTIGYQLRLADVATMQSFAQAFAGARVTPARFTTLELVARNPGIRPAELADAMAVRSSNLAPLLRDLERDGWIAHERSSDRREKRLRLTDAGRRSIASLRERLREHDAQLSAGLSPAERRQLSRLLGKLLAGVRPSA